MKHTIFILTILYSFCIPLKGRSITVTANENVEMMSILSCLADYSEYNMRVAGKYNDDVKNYFEKYKNHPAVLKMKHIRKTYRIAYDAVMSMAIHLCYKDDSFQLMNNEHLLDKRWSNVNKTLFLSLLTDFYKDSSFSSFYAEHFDFYKEGILYFKEKVLIHFSPDWCEDFFGRNKKENFSIIIGFCNGYGNYGVARMLENNKKEIFSIMGYYVGDTGKPMYNSYDVLPTLLHEFNHSFINYLLDDSKNSEALEKAGNFILKTTAWSMYKQSYNNWNTIINESLVRSIVICYLIDKGFEDKIIYNEITEQLQKNFRWIPKLVKLINEKYLKERDDYPTFESFYPVIISFFNDYISKEKNEIERLYDSK